MLILSPLLIGEFPTDFDIDFDRPLYLLLGTLTLAFQLFLAYLLFRIRRFRNGFPFLLKGYAVILALITTGIVLGLSMWITGINEPSDVYVLVAGILIVGVGIYIWIRRGIKVFFGNKQNQRNDDILQQEIDKLTRENQQLRDINETVRAENHSINHRLASLERNYVRAIEMSKLYIAEEMVAELAADLNKIRMLSKEYQENIGRVKVETALPTTNVQAVDDLFALFAERFAENEIEFMLKVKSSIVYMVESVIPQAALETMIGDHLQNALIAVNANKDSFRSVRATIGKAGDFYEFTVHDSGIPFEPNTLVQLGTERVTTHADSGGSGVGFMKTFDTMRECGASLIIRENRGGVFSKSVTVRFNGLNQYIIETYRPGGLPKSNRYTVIGHSS